MLSSFISLLPPLSEDEPLLLSDVQEFLVEQGDVRTASDTFLLAAGEQRHLKLRILLKQHAQARMIWLCDVPAGAKLTIMMWIEAEAGAVCNSTVLVRGGGEIQLRRALHVFGPGVQIEHNCVAWLNNSARMSASEEMTTQHTQSDLAIRTHFVLNDTSEAVTRARVVASAASQDSVITEDLHGLVLGDKARLRAIPELEVQTDRLECSHRMSSLPLDQETAFYLRSRGLTQSQVQSLLARSFAAPILERLPEQQRYQCELFLFEA